jgi:hypothetical protein
MNLIDIGSFHWMRASHALLRHRVDRETQLWTRIDEMLPGIFYEVKEIERKWKRWPVIAN